MGELQRYLINVLNIPQVPLSSSKLSGRIRNALLSSHATNFFGFKVESLEILCTIHQKISIDGIGQTSQYEIKMFQDKYNLNAILEKYIKKVQIAVD